MHENPDDHFRETAADTFVSEAALARHWNVSCRTLQRLRHRHEGPAYVLIGRSIRYRVSDILNFETHHRSTGGKS